MINTEEKEFICSVCGKSSIHSVISENIAPSGVPDLDLRPDGKLRETLGFLVMECPHCGYCNSTLSAAFDGEKDYLTSEEYKTLGGIDTENETASRYIRKALCMVKNHSYKDAVKGYLSAAWALDDANDMINAALCRSAAVNVIDSHPAAFKGDSNFRILLADLLRRSGEFDRVLREYSGEAFKSQLMTAIAFFEVQLAAQGDSAAHRANEVPGVSAAR